MGCPSCSLSLASFIEDPFPPAQDGCVNIALRPVSVVAHSIAAVFPAFLVGVYGLLDCARAGPTITRPFLSCFVVLRGRGIRQVCP